MIHSGVPEVISYFGGLCIHIQHVYLHDQQGHTISALNKKIKNPRKLSGSVP